MFGCLNIIESVKPQDCFHSSQTPGAGFLLRPAASLPHAQATMLCWTLSHNFIAFCYLLLQSLSGTCHPGKSWVMEHITGKITGL